MTRVDTRWMKMEKYWHFADNGEVTIHDDAPKEFRDLYELYRKQVEAAAKRGTL